jgi:hypothetical protein
MIYKLSFLIWFVLFYDSFGLFCVTVGRMTIDQYFKDTNELFYNPKVNDTSSSSSSKESQEPLVSMTVLGKPEQLDFMDYFLSLVDTSSDFCVSHDELVKYGVIKRSTDATHILRLLQKTHNFIEGIDYIVNTAITSNGNMKSIYMMKPYAFKVCLIRSKNTNRYMRYYLQLEDVYRYYQKYEKLYMNHVLNDKNEKIDKLQVDIIEEKNRAEKERIDAEAYRVEARERDRLNNEKIDKLLKRTDMTLEQLDRISGECEEANEKLDTLADGVKTIKKIVKVTCSNVRKPAPSTKPKNRTEFILLQNKNNLNEFKFHRAVKKRNEITMKSAFGGENNVIRREYDANPGTLFNVFKATIREELRDDIRHHSTKGMDATAKRELADSLEKVNINRLVITLKNGFTQTQFYNLLDRVFMERYDAFTTVNDIVDVSE